MYLLVGRFTSGGTTGPSGLLIGTEFFSGTPDAVLDELGTWERTYLRSSDALLELVVHELIHFQQPSETANALEHAISEGGADFVAPLLVGVTPSDEKYRYARGREQELGEEFRPQM